MITNKEEIFMSITNLRREESSYSITISSLMQANCDAVSKFNSIQLGDVLNHISTNLKEDIAIIEDPEDGGGELVIYDGSLGNLMACYDVNEIIYRHVRSFGIGTVKGKCHFTIFLEAKKG